MDHSSSIEEISSISLLINFVREIQFSWVSRNPGQFTALTDCSNLTIYSE